LRWPSADNYSQSIFGMNVKTPLFSHTLKSNASSPSAFPTPTLTTTVDPSAPSQHYWTISQYLEISLPLTMAVILLPLIAGPCFKFASQQYEVHRRHWRALFVVLAACYFVGLILLLSISSDWLLYLCLCYTVLGKICLVRVVRAHRQKQGRLRWSLQLLTFLACLFLETGLLVHVEVPWGLLQYLSIFLTSKTGVRWLKRKWTWLSWKTKRQSAAGHSSVTTV
jgi:peptidoglycan/LPS O-acetylase OafA/YrhL